jgi:prophage regulatory protein
MKRKSVKSVTPAKRKPPKHRLPTAGAQLVAYPQLIDFGVPFSRMHISRMEKAGKFPMHIKLGGKSIAWVRDELDAWLAQRMKARPTIVAAE